MSTASKKAKGREWQQAIRQHIIDALSLDPELVVSTPMGCAGADVVFYGDAKKAYPSEVECKNQKALAWWDAIKQAASRSADWALFVKRDSRSDPEVVVLPLNKYLELIKEK